MEKMRGALEGIRILELTGARTEYGAMLLAGMGAEVWLMEPPHGGSLRRIGPFKDGEPGLERSLPFHAYNLNKKGITLDIETGQGQELFRALLPQMDAVMESCPPGALDGLGIGPRECCKAHPPLIWLSATPYGSTGPHAHFVGSDISAQAMGGAMATTGEANGRVYQAGGTIGDKMTGYTAAAALMVAILQRLRTGRGQHVDISAQEALAGQMETGTIFYTFTGTEPARGGRLYPVAAFPCGLFPASDGWISLVALQPQHWDALVEWIDDDRLRQERFKIGSERALARDEIDQAICDWSRKRSKYELAREGQKRRIAIADLKTPRDVIKDEHLLAANYFRTLEHAEIGTLRVAGAPFNASLTPFHIEHAGPRLGEHNNQIYGTVRNAEEREKLRAEGVI